MSESESLADIRKSFVAAIAADGAAVSGKVGGRVVH
jgi:hypothetical protein